MKLLKLNLFTLALIGVFYVNAQSNSTSLATAGLAYTTGYSSNIGMSSGYLNSYDYIYTSESDSVLFRNYRDFITHPEKAPLQESAKSKVNSADPNSWPMYELTYEEPADKYSTNEKLELLQVRLAQLKNQIKSLKQALPQESK